MRNGVHILLITGPAGIGKSTLTWEIGAQLTAKGIEHAIVETDELDRVYPRPTAQDLDRVKPGTTDVSSLNLAAIWSTYHALGHSRLIMSGVMMHLDFDRRWIAAAIPEARITVVRLMGDDATLLSRLARREMGPGAQEQEQRSLRQSQRMRAQKTDGIIAARTDDKSPQVLAAAILQEIGWIAAAS